MNNSHTFLIGLIISIIVAAQIVVFILTVRKIRIFRSIFPDSQSFTTVKQDYTDDSKDNNMVEVPNADLQTGEENKNQQSDNSTNPEKYVYVKNAFETKRIKSKNLHIYLKDGWYLVP